MGFSPPKKIEIGMNLPADLVFDPTLAVWNVRSYTFVPHYWLSQELSWTDLHLSRTMLPGALAGLRGSFCLRLASTFNHRPDMIILHHYKREEEKKQALLESFSQCMVFFP